MRDRCLSQSQVFPLEQMPVRKMANGGESRDVMHGALMTGEVVGVHESVQPAGSDAESVAYDSALGVDYGAGGDGWVRA